MASIGTFNMEEVLVLCIDSSYLLLHQVPPAQVEVDHDGAGVEPDQDVGGDQAHAVGGGGQLQPGQAHLHRVSSEQVLARGGGTLLLVDQVTRSWSLDTDTSRSSDTAIATTSFLCLSSNKGVKSN